MTSMREIRLLQRLNHPNILNIHDIVSEKDCVYMVFEYMEYDLTGLMSHPSFVFTEEYTRCIMRQCLLGLSYLHGCGILHRDIKGSNILMNRMGHVKLADFGLARVASYEGDYTNRVITLWYRPTELLFGTTKYGAEIDIWGMGCIMVEMFSKGKPLFAGIDEVTQLQMIMKIKGSDIESEWEGVTQLPWYSFMKPKEEYPNTLRRRLRYKFTERITSNLS